MVETKSAVGMVLCHDITKIVPGEFKGVAFKKGHVVKTEDIEELLNIGKEHLYVWECNDSQIHENEAAIRISEAVAGGNIEFSSPREGKVNLIANTKGLLKINVGILALINDIEEVVVATRHTNQLIEKGDTIAGTRVIPLLIDKVKIETVEKICQDSGPIIEVKPFKPLKTVVITTGSEVYNGRIKDRFGPVVIRKVQQVGCTVQKHILLPDDRQQIALSIREAVKEGAEMVIVTGGMSVDPDDATPGGVKEAGAKLVTYGSPLFPGAMFLLAYLDDVPIMGLPGCVMYSKATVFDVLLPRIIAGEKIKREEITRLGHGGLCLDCEHCHYPNCSFGKG